jgi:hypothetical protein
MALVEEVVIVWVLGAVFFGYVHAFAPTPFIRSPKPGERRLFYGLKQLGRFFAWPLAVGYYIAVAIPRLVRWLLEPVDD